jgi:hypothetical protein
MQAVTEYAYELAFGLHHTADATHTAQDRERQAFILGSGGDPRDARNRNES